MNWAKTHEINKEAGVLLLLYIQPGASKTRVFGTHQERLKISVQSPPVDGAANEAVIEFFKKILKIPKNRIHLILGETSRLKNIWIKDASLEAVTNALETAMLKK